MKKLILLLLAALLISCNDKGTNPPPPSPPAKSVRDYTWTLDTLNLSDAAQNMMEVIYASSAKDIYLVGHNSGTQIYPGDGDMWHYNGDEWSVVRLHDKLGNFTIFGIDGSSSDNIWIIGFKHFYSEDFYRGFAAHYDGSTWSESKVNSKNMIYSVLVESENEVWACGDGGLVYHYENNTWNIDTLSTPEVDNPDRFTLTLIAGDDKNKYVCGIYSPTDLISYYYILKLIDDKWKIIDTFNNVTDSYYHFGISDLYYSKSGELYTVGPEVYKKTSAAWEKLSVDHLTWIRAITANGPSNVLVAGLGRAFHFNGSNWYEIKEATDEGVSYRDIWMDDNNVFIIGFKTIDNSAKTIVLHGN